MGVLLSLIIMFFLLIISHAEETRLIVRGDDLGMTQGTLLAFERAFNKGVLTCERGKKMKRHTDG